jgi:hypothetical protein
MTTADAFGGKRLIADYIAAAAEDMTERES